MPASDPVIGHGYNTYHTLTAIDHYNTPEAPEDIAARWGRVWDLLANYCQDPQERGRLSFFRATVLGWRQEDDGDHYSAVVMKDPRWVFLISHTWVTPEEADQGDGQGYWDSKPVFALGYLGDRWVCDPVMGSPVFEPWASVQEFNDQCVARKADLRELWGMPPLAEPRPQGQAEAGPLPGVVTTNPGPLAWNPSVEVLAADIYRSDQARILRYSGATPRAVTGRNAFDFASNFQLERYPTWRREYQALPEPRMTSAEPAQIDATIAELSEGLDNPLWPTEIDRSPVAPDVTEPDDDVPF